MSSSEERRDVARRLRELDHEITSYDTIESGVNKLKKAVHGNTSFSPIEYSVRKVCGLANTLADIIDPTCKNKYRNHDDRSFLCSKCGYEAFTYDDSYCDPDEFRFCPNCGARVVSHDDN